MIELLFIVVIVCAIAIAWAIARIESVIRCSAEMLKAALNEHIKGTQAIYDVLERIEKKLPPR